MVWEILILVLKYFKWFKVDKNSGLNDQQLSESLKSNGYNELNNETKDSALKIFLSQFKDFIVIILILAALISMFLGDIKSMSVILVVITINSIIGTWQHIKAEKSLESLKAMASPNAKVIRNGNKLEIPSREIAVGDILLLEAGDLVNADGRLIAT